jgi:hypothetical protein
MASTTPPAARTPPTQASPAATSTPTVTATQTDSTTPPPTPAPPAATTTPTSTASSRSPAPAEASAAIGAASDASLEELLAAWPVIVERLSAHPPTKPLILNCRPVAVDGAIVTLGFPEEQPFLKEQAERRRPGIEAGIAAVVGHPVTVRCVVANVEVAPAGADDLVAEARRIFAEELIDVGEVS